MTKNMKLVGHNLDIDTFQIEALNSALSDQARDPRCSTNTFDTCPDGQESTHLLADLGANALFGANDTVRGTSWDYLGI